MITEEQLIEADMVSQILNEDAKESTVLTEAEFAEWLSTQG